MIRITPDISIGQNEIRMDFVRAGGPGGQHVNKVSSAAQLRFDISASTTLPDDVKGRLMALAGKRVSRAGVLIIHASRRKSQQRNSDDALRRFVDLVRQAACKPKVRRKTRPTAASRIRRLDSKRKRARQKQLRGTVNRDE